MRCAHVLDEHEPPAGLQNASGFGEGAWDIVHGAQDEGAEDHVCGGVIEWESLCRAAQDRQLELVPVGSAPEVRVEVDVGLYGHPVRSGGQVLRIRPGPRADLYNPK